LIIRPGVLGTYMGDGPPDGLFPSPGWWRIPAEGCSRAVSVNV
jgi:uncharacterized membrane protein